MADVRSILARLLSGPAPARPWGVPGDALATTATNPVGWSSTAAPQYMSNADPSFSELARKDNMTPQQQIGAMLLGKGRPITNAQLPAAEDKAQTFMDYGMGVAGATAPVAKVDANWLRAALKERGLNFTETHSKSFSDVHGPSASQYFKVGDKTIRLSDHTYGTGNAADLRYGMDATRAAQELDYALGRGPRPAPIQDPIREYVFGLTKKQLNAALDNAGIKNISNADKESRLLEYLRSKGVAGAVNPVGIRAYHGSPHTFDKFDMSKLGTGEGAQAYGHGLYFAGAEDVARSYKQKLAPSANKFLTEGDPQIKALWDAGSKAIKGTGLEKKLYRLPSIAGSLRGKSWEEAASSFEEAARKAKKGSLAQSTLQADAALVRALDKSGVVNPFSGSMYEVNLRTSPDRLLDWDKPLSAQPAAKNLPETIRNIDETAAAVLGRGFRNETHGGDLIGANRASPDAVAKGLASRGIDGIQYLDGGSRAAGEGSRNYVMFDDKLIDILRRYGLLGLVGGGAAAAGSNPAGAKQ